jgi:hypothetical protein
MADQKQENKYSYQPMAAADAAALWAQHRLITWAGNRPINMRRAARIAAYVAAGNDFGPVPIVIGVVRIPPAGGVVEYVIDGQHRLQAATLLGRADARRAQLCICRTVCRNEDELRQLFTMVNCGTPVPASYWDADVAAFINGVVGAINRRWPGIITQGTSLRRPYIPLVQLRADIDSHVRTREAAVARVLSVDDAVRELEAMNSTNRLLIASDSVDTRTQLAMANFTATPSILKFADLRSFYVGLEKEWPNKLMSNLGRTWRAADEDGDAEDAE